MSKFNRKPLLNGFPSFALFFGLLLTGGAAFAQEGGAGSAGWFQRFLAEFNRIFVDLVNKAFGDKIEQALIDSGNEFAANLIPVALALAGALALVTLLWRLTLAMVNKESIGAATFEVLLFSIISLAVIQNYTMLTDQVHKIGKGALTAIGLDIASTFKEYLEAFVLPLGAVMSKIGENATSGSWSSIFKLEFYTATLDAIASLMLAFFVIILLVYSLLMVIPVFLMGPVFFAVGIIFGPIMIATIVSPMTRRWFDQWLNFMVGAAFLTATAIAVLKLLSKTIGQYSISMDEGASTFTLLALALIAAATGRLFTAIPNITDAIFPGRTGAGSAIGQGGSVPGGKVAMAAAGAAVGAAAAGAGGSGAGMSMGNISGPAAAAASGAGGGAAGGGGAGGGGTGGGSTGGGGLPVQGSAKRLATGGMKLAKTAGRAVATTASTINSTVGPNSAMGRVASAAARGQNPASAIGSMAKVAVGGVGAGMSAAGSAAKSGFQSFAGMSEGQQQNIDSNPGNQGGENKQSSGQSDPNRNW